MDAGAAQPTLGTWPVGYRQAVDFYLREDVAAVLFSLAQRRRLHFYYHTDRDYRQRDASRARLSLHCPRDVGTVQETIRAAVAEVSDCGSPFYPFFTMASRANAPGSPAATVGWDFCFECDLDLVGSFRALTPLVGVLDHFRVPHLAKYSGRRSLHVIIPAEALPPAVGGADPAEWLRVQRRLGRLLCRLVPGLSATWVGIATARPLTAPYSLHRYSGLVSLPLSLDSALDFDPESARVERFLGVAWRPEVWDDAGDGGARLLELADASERDPDLALDAASAVFVGDRWRRHVEGDRRAAGSVEQAIFAGAVGLAHLPDDVRADPSLADRVRRAIAALDDPEVKTMRFQRLFAPDEHGILPLAGRSEASRALAAWVASGALGALDVLVDELLSAKGGGVGEILRAVRICGLLPESAAAKLAPLAVRWKARRGESDSVALFLALALGELSPDAPEAADLLSRNRAGQDEGQRGVWRRLIQREGGWRAEVEPATALAALGLAFGAESVSAWLERPDEAGRLLRDGVFGGDAGKLAHAARGFLGAHG